MKRLVGGRLAQFVKDLHTAYRLEFVPPVLDGGVHLLEVRVRKPGHTTQLSTHSSVFAQLQLPLIRRWPV